MDEKEWHGSKKKIFFDRRFGGWGEGEKMVLYSV